MPGIKRTGWSGLLTAKFTIPRTVKNVRSLKRYISRNITVRTAPQFWRTRRLAGHATLKWPERASERLIALGEEQNSSSKRMRSRHKLLRAKRAYYVRHPKRVAAANRRWRTANRDKVKLANHRWYLAHSTKVKSAAIAWRACNLEQARRLQRSYKAKTKTTKLILQTYALKQHLKPTH